MHENHGTVANESLDMFRDNRARHLSCLSELEPSLDQPLLTLVKVR